MTYKIGWKEGGPTEFVTTLSAPPVALDELDCNVWGFGGPGGFPGGVATLPPITEANAGHVYTFFFDPLALLSMDVHCSGTDVITLAGVGSANPFTFNGAGGLQGIWVMSDGFATAGSPNGIWYMMGSYP